MAKTFVKLSEIRETMIINGKRFTALQHFTKRSSAVKYVTKHKKRFVDIKKKPLAKQSAHLRKIKNFKFSIQKWEQTDILFKKKNVTLYIVYGRLVR